MIKYAQTVLDVTADGKIGPITLSAAEKVKSKIKNWASMSDERRVISAAQVILNDAGFEAGLVDGYWGHNTGNAYDDYNGNLGTIDRTEEKTAPASSLVFPRQRDMESFYGAAGSSRATAGKAILPFPFVIAWNTSQSVSRFSCHELVAAPMTAIFTESARHYGEDEFRRLRLDRFGGCYNNRKMRGGSSKSTHACGIAVDLDPENNQLKWGRDRASFARPEYEPFWKIVESHGAISLGREKNFDWMHFQFARL
jgi:hypothetical protein